MNNLGELFRQIRQNKNWSIRTAAKKMGISYSYLSILEKGIDLRTGKDSCPKPDTLRLISKGYNYPYEELLKAAGYLNDSYNPELTFDRTVFSSNLKLVMGKMNNESFSKDINKKTGYKISPHQIEGYLNGDIEPFSGTITILCKYAEVRLNFWYIFNTLDSLADERQKYTKYMTNSIHEQFDKDSKAFLSIDDNIRKWILSDNSMDFIKIAMDAHMNKISPQALQTFINSILADRKQQSVD
jgi:transcriptional regulator with XRE-family HTH domain